MPLSGVATRNAWPQNHSTQPDSKTGSSVAGIRTVGRHA